MSADDHDRLLELEGDFKAMRAGIDEKFLAHKLALEKADGVLEARLETMNEFRTQINGERSDYVRKDALEARLKPIERSLDYMRGRDKTALVFLSLAVAGATSLFEVIRLGLGR